MSATIFINGCACGANSVYTARVRKAYPFVEVVNTRADRSRLEEHIQWQDRAGMGKTPVPIVVENDGTVISTLKEWKQ